MENDDNNFPIIDLHCDMLYYLVTENNAAPENKDDIGCAIPHLESGKVKLQVMALACIEDLPDPDLTVAQAHWFGRFFDEYGDIFETAADPENVRRLLQTDKIGILAAIENAAGLCRRNEPLNCAFHRLEEVINTTGKLLYISLTHHGETRFGGGNQTDIGLKDDGRALLDYIDGKKMAVDLSHASDALAHDIINHIETGGLRLPIIASHSNYRAVYDHPRNLPDELAQEIINRQGLIGINFLRAFLHPDNPEVLMDHIIHGLELGGEKAVCFGADFFCTKSHPDKTRIPFYFEPHESAGKYQQILQRLPREFGQDIMCDIAYGNVMRFILRVLS